MSKNGDANQLPKHWKTARLDQICDAIVDCEHSTAKFVETGIPCVDTTCMKPGQIVHDKLRFVSQDTYNFRIRRLEPQPGDLIFAREGTVGTAVKVPDGFRCCLGQRVMLFRPNVCFDSKFLECALTSDFVRRQYQKKILGTTSPHLNVRDIKPLLVPVVSPNEQRRIVAKIEELFSDLDAGVAALERAKANLKRYRAAVLKAAVEGKLTAAWRAENPCTESAADLLQRILHERHQKWEQQQLAKYTENGKQPPKDWRAKYEQPAFPETTNLPELPKNWTWATVEQCRSFEPNAITDGPFGSNLKTSHYTAEGPRVIRLQNIGNGSFLDDEAHVSQEHFETLSKHSVNSGDVIVAMLGETLPRTCVVPSHVPPAIVKADCARYSTCRSLMLPGYANLAMNAASTRMRVSALITGVGRPRLNLSKVRAIALPLPPFAEQEVIIAEVEQRFSIVDALVTELERGTLRAARLRQSILKRAFEGNLVPQDPSDEPAASQLERIQNDRDAARATVHETSLKPGRRAKRG